MNMCEYDCGQESKFILKNGKKCCSQRECQCPSQRKKRSDAVKLAHSKYKAINNTGSFKKGSFVQEKNGIQIDNTVCSYCGNIAHFTLKNGKGCCESNPNKCPSIRAKNSKGVSKAHLEGRMFVMSHDDIRRRWWLFKSAEEVQIIRKKQGKTYSEGVKNGSIIPSSKGRVTSLETKERQSASASEKNNGFVKTQYYSVFSPYMGKEVKVQGTWEYKFACYLNENNILWERSKTKHLKYKLTEEDYIHTYYPDFFLPETRTYVEIKGYWWKSADGRVDDKRKMKKVIECNQDKTILILQKEELASMGILI